MMTIAIALLLTAVGIAFIWRVLFLMGRFRLTDEPTAPAEYDGDTGVREPRPKHPPAMSGAVALEEPDEE